MADEKLTKCSICRERDAEYVGTTTWKSDSTTGVYSCRMCGPCRTLLAQIMERIFHALNDTYLLKAEKKP
jgi:hypothetical protein